MGAVKKAYQNWCEKNDIEPDSAEARALDDLQHEAWRKEFGDWLDGIAKKYSRDDQKDEGEA